MGYTMSNQEWAGSLQERFWAKVGPETEMGCWPWMGAKDPNGYGRFTVHRSMSTKLAHRVAFSLEAGRDSDAQALLHVCDNPCCVNPAHLSEGTQRDNILDSVSKGRNAVGERLPQSRLTEEGVKAIRSAFRGGEHILSIANRFGVSRRSAQQAAVGETWKHVGEEA